MNISWLEKQFIDSSFFVLWRKITVRHLLQNIPTAEGRILEIGCGSGITTVELARSCPNKIFAIDSDSELVKKTLTRIKNSNLRRRVVVRKDTAVHLAFRNNTFSEIFSFLTFHHVKEWKRALQESYRVLTPGGNLYIEDLALHPHPLLRHFGIYAPSVYSVKEFTCELQRAGFSILNVQGSWRFFVHARKTRV